MTKGIGGSTARAELAGVTPTAVRAPGISPSEYEARHARARSLMAAIGADALIIGAGPSLRYFTGVAWAPTERLVALLLPRRGSPVMICPAFELGSLEASLAISADVRLWQEHESPYRLAAGAAREAGSVLAFDPALPFFVFDGLRRADPALELIGGAPVVDGCRTIKSAARR
jgi:Xaa-Pro dipeptidase